MGALAHYVSHADPMNYQPTNIAYGLIPSLDEPARGRQARRQALARRALADLKVTGQVAEDRDGTISAKIS